MVVSQYGPQYPYNAVTNAIGYQPGSAQDPNTQPAAAPTNSAGQILGTSSPTAQATDANGNAYNSTTQGFTGSTAAPSVLGTGTFTATPYAINDNAITGQPTQGASTDYGLNDVWGSINGALASSGSIGGNANASAAQVAPATQINAATGNAAQGNATYGNAAQGQAQYGTAATGQAASMNAATGSASQAQLATAQAAQGNAALAQAAQMRAAQGGYAQAAGTNISTANPFVSQQQAQITQLQNQAAGNGPSVAATQLQQGEQQQVANQLAVLGSQRGSANAALAQRSAADQTAAAQQNLAANQAVAREQEELNAQNTLASTLATASGQTQTLNTNQANLNQATNQYNASNAQAATLNNTNLQQAANTTNAGLAQQTALSNQGAVNTQTAQNVGNQQATNVLNANNANQLNQYNATNSQNMTLANMTDQQNAAQQNAQLAQAMTTTNVGNEQAMNLANVGYGNAMTQSNLANQQASNLANQQAANNMTTTNLAAQNTFGLQNMSNQQAANVANQNALNTASLTQAQYNQATGLANQGMTLSNAQLQAQQQLGLLGAQTGIAESNKASALANQQLQVQQQIANNQVNATAYSNSANANAALTGSALSALGTVASTAVSMAAKSGQNVTFTGSDGNTYTATANGVYPSSGYSSSSTDPLAGQIDPSTGLTYGSSAETSATENDTGTDDPLDSYSDENLKTGIEGGNPMLRSFLQQVYANSQQSSNIDPTVGTNFRLTKTTTSTPGTANTDGGIGSKVGGALGGAAAGALAGSVVPGIGTVIGGLIGSIAGGLAGGAVDSTTGTPGTSSTKTTGSGYFDNANISDGQDNDLNSQAGLTMSDEDEKEAVSSGNRGLQSFLQQANANQQVNNTPGTSASNQAFQPMMPAGTPQRMTAPPSFNNSNPSFAGTFQAGGNTMGGIQYPAGYSQGSPGVSQTGGFQQGGSQGGGYATANYQQGGLTNAGSYGSTSPITAGTINGGGITPGNYSNGGTWSAPAPNTPVPSTWTNPAASSWINSISNPVANPAVANLPNINNAATPTLSTAPPAYLPVSNYTNPVTSSAINSIETPATSPYVASSTPVFSPLMSDEDQKTDKSSGDTSQRDFLNSLSAYNYRYKDPTLPGTSPGEKTGVMAQDLERSDIGKRFVVNTPNGKMVKYSEMAPVLLASQAMLNDRINKLEAKKGKN